MKKGAWIGMGMVAMALLLTACGSGGKSGGAKNASKPTLKIMTWNVDPGNAKREQEVFDEFTKDTGIKVEQVTADYNKYNEKFMTMAAGKKLPDLTWILPNSFSKFVSEGLLLPLDEYVKKDIDTSKLVPRVMDFGKVDGKQYGMTRDYSTTFMTYNKDMFDKAGVAYPKPGWTWDDFMKIADKFKKVQNGKTVQFAVTDMNTTASLLSMAGSYLVNMDEKITFDDAQSLKYVKMYRDMVNKYNYQPSAAQMQGVNNAFLAQKTAMQSGGVWEWKNFKENAKFNWDITTFPRGKAGKLIANQQQIAITSQTKHKAEAWKLLKWLTYGRGQKIQGDKLGAVSVLKSNVNDMAKVDYAPEHATILMDEINSGRPVQPNPYISSFSEIESGYITQLSNFVQNKTSDKKIDATLKKLAADDRQKFGLK
ncbi:ABC transporter substrate-binding protein [Lacticaseibacillus suihuaensis]